MPNTEAEWEAEDAAYTLVRAEEIKSDKKLLAKALKKLREQTKATATALADVTKNNK